MTDEPTVSFDKPATPAEPAPQPAPQGPRHSPPTSASGYGDPPPNPGYGPSAGHGPGYGYPPVGYPGYGHPGYGYPPAGYPGYGYPFAPPGPPHEKPSSNIGWAIAAVLTFWPLAIPSFIYANKVDTYWFAGNRAGAQQASKDARLWGMIGVIIGAVFFVLAIVWIVVVVTTLAHAAHDFPDPTSYPTP